MKVIKKTYCPDQIDLNGTTLKMYVAASALPNNNARHKAEALKAQGLIVAVVEVLSNSLKGKTDLHGKLYTPSVFIFSDLHTDEQIKAWREKVDFWKSQFRPRTKTYIKNVLRLNKAGKLQHFKGPEEIAAQNQAIKELLN